MFVVALIARFVFKNMRFVKFPGVFRHRVLLAEAWQRIRFVSFFHDFFRINH